MTDMRIPRIAVTLGDPAGIGTEIALRAIQDPDVTSSLTPVLFGSAEVVAREIRRAGHDLEVSLVTPATAGPAISGIVQVVPTSGAEALIPYGVVAAAGGEAAVSAVRAAVLSTMAGDVDAICTAPLNKESLRLAGYPFDGHTEMLAAYTDHSAVTMLLIGRRLRVAHLTTHTSIRQVPDKITPDRLRFVIAIAHRLLQEYGIAAPRIAVAGLNPHAGENGLFGDEEQTVMRPVIEEMRLRGHDIVGPISPDAVFINALDGRYDLVVVAYHDQGHIPVKLIEREYAVNVTGGLPIIRTSVDHGTAFDIAGTGRADSTNMTCALELAAQFAQHRIVARH